MCLSICRDLVPRRKEFGGAGPQPCSETWPHIGEILCTNHSTYIDPKCIAIRPLIGKECKVKSEVEGESAFSLWPTNGKAALCASAL